MAHGRRRLRLGPIGAAVISGWLTACGGSAAPPPLADRPTATATRPRGDSPDESPRRRSLAEPAPPLPEIDALPERATAELLAYSSWLHATRPDGRLVGAAFARGTELERRTRRDLATLQRTGRRLLETTNGEDIIRVVSVTGHAASVRVVQDLTGIVLLGPDGRVVQRVTAGRTSYLVLLIRNDGGPWLLAAIDEEGPA
ncbi:MAG: hypothetical protein ACKOBG_11220 [Actinomycetota bacterium]